MNKKDLDKLRRNQTMSDIIKHSKKILSATLTVSTIVWAVGLFAFVPQVDARAGDLVKQTGDPAVYLVDADGVTIHPFPHYNVYNSWGYPANFGTVLTTNLSGFTVGNDVEFRDGSLIRALETPAVYAVSGKVLRPIVSAEVFETLGYNYDNITWLPQSFLDKYGTTGTMLESTTLHPNGTLVKYASSSTVYLIQDGAKRAFSSASVIASNGYAGTPVITIPSSETYADGSSIVVTEEAIMVPTGVGTAPAVGTVPGTETPVGSGLTVSLASDTPAASTVIADSTAGGNDGAQAFIPFIKVALTAGSDGAVKVTNMSFKRAGISADSDISAFYLYEGDELADNLLSASTSFSSGVATFNAPAGLITIPAGQTKYVMLRADLADDVGSGNTIVFSLASASSITTDGAAVSGSFPMNGNTMSTATTATLGSITIANVSPAAASSVDPGTLGHELWRFSLVAADQDMEIRYLKFSMTGSASSSDVDNFKLQVVGTDIATVATMNANDELVFNFATPYLIEKGQTKNVSLIGDVNGGSNRTIHFQLQEMYHANVFDTEYNVYTKINLADSWTIIESNSSTTNTTVNAGTLTVSKSTNSPTGNVAAGDTNVVLARFDFKANGEDVKISSLVVATTAALAGVNDVRVFFDGSQVGSTADSTAALDYASFTFGTSMTIPAGETKVVEIRSDIKNAAAANLTAGDSIAATLNAGSSNARALASSTSISTPSIAGNTLTVQSGTLVTAENTSVIDASITNPSGVKGDTGVLIGSFTLTAGSGEGVTITQITMKDDADGSTTGSSLADVFQNLRLESGGPADASGNYAAGTAIGTTKGSLTDTAATTYNFNPSPSIKLSASQQIVVNVYADVLNSVAGLDLTNINVDTTGVIYPSVVTATGTSTSADASDSNGTNAGLQNVYIASSGSLIVENVASSSQTKARIVNAGATDVELYKFKLTALIEDIEITRFIITDTIVSSAYGATTSVGKPTSTLYNFKLYDGTTEIGGGAKMIGGTATSTPTNGGYIDFTLGTAYTVSAGAEKTITLKGSVQNWSGMSSGSTHVFSLQGTASSGAVSGPLEDNSTYAVVARGTGSSTVVSGPSTDQNGTAVTARRAYPLVQRLALPTTTLSSSGQHTVAKFTVTAVGGEVRLKKMAFDIAWTDTTTSTLMKLNNFKLYRNAIQMSNSAVSGTGEFVIYDGLGTADTNQLSGGTDGYLQMDSTFHPTEGTSTSTRAVLVFGAHADYDAAGDTGSGEEVISSGATITYEIRADVTNAHQGASTDADTITVTLLGDDGETQPLTANLIVNSDSSKNQFGVVTIGTTQTDDYNFIWSDYSENTNSHTHTIPSTGTGWTHGYQVPSTSEATSFIPLDNWTLQK